MRAGFIGSFLGHDGAQLYAHTWMAKSGRDPPDSFNFFLSTPLFCSYARRDAINQRKHPHENDSKHHGTIAAPLSLDLQPVEQSALDAPGLLGADAAQEFQPGGTWHGRRALRKKSSGLERR